MSTSPCPVEPMCSGAQENIATMLGVMSQPSLFSDCHDLFTSMYTAATPLPRTSVTATLSTKHSRRHHPNETLRQSVLDRWSERLAKNSKLFNGTKFRLSNVEHGSMDSNAGILHLCLSITDYASYLGTNWNPQFQHLLLEGETDSDRSYLSDPLGVGGVCITTDNHIVFIRRSQHVGEYPGFMDVPGGHPEPSKVKGCEGSAWQFDDDSMDSSRSMDSSTSCSGSNSPASSSNSSSNCNSSSSGGSSSISSGNSNVGSEILVSEFFQSIEDEIHEEINIPPNKLHDNKLLLIMRQTKAAGRPSAVFQITCDLTSEEVREYYEQGPKEAFESTALVLMPIAEIRKMTLATMRTEMTPACVGSLLVWRHLNPI
jgi:hypothetical protein